MSKKSLIIFALVWFTACTSLMAKSNSFYSSKRNISGISGNFKELVGGGYGNSFFENDIKVKFPDYSSVLGYDVDRMTSALNSMHVGKEVLNLLFMRTADGTMSEDLLKQRAMLNVQLNDRERAEIGVLDASTIMKEDYLPILKNNFIFLYKKVSPKKTAWILFHVDIDESTLNDVFAAWNDTEKYNAIQVNVSCVKSGLTKTKRTSKYNYLLRRISKDVDLLAIRGQVISRNPFLTDIGGRQGLKNADRLFVYRQKQDKDGNYYSSKVSTVRAVNVGDTISTLYTIAGGQASFKKGDVAVFRADKKVGNSFFFGFMNHTKEFGYMFDRLLSMKNHGVSRHLLVNYSYVFYEGARTTVYAYNDGDLYRAPRIHNVGVGYGIGFTFAHSIQMMPYACGQFDILQSKTKDGDEGYGYAQFRIPVGLKLNVNIAYPLQLTGGLEYGICFGGKSDKNERDYNALKSYFYDARGWKRNGPKAYIGLRICM